MGTWRALPSRSVSVRRGRHRLQRLRLLPAPGTALCCGGWSPAAAPGTWRRCVITDGRDGRTRAVDDESASCELSAAGQLSEHSPLLTADVPRCPSLPTALRVSPKKILIQISIWGSPHRWAFTSSEWRSHRHGMTGHTAPCVGHGAGRTGWGREVAASETAVRV